MKKSVAIAFLLVVSLAVFSETKSVDERLLGTWNIKQGSRFSTIVFVSNGCSIYDGKNIVSNNSAYSFEDKLFIDDCGYKFEISGDGNIIKLIPYFESAGIIILERKK